LDMLGVTCQGEGFLYYLRCFESLIVAPEHGDPWS